MPQALKRAWDDSGLFGLRFMFRHRYMFEAFREWTALSFKVRFIVIGISTQQLYWYIRQEIALSLTCVSVMSNKWHTKSFSCLNDFRAVKSHDSFKEISSCLCPYPTYDHDMALCDPLWHSRDMLNHFMRKCVPWLHLSVSCLLKKIRYFLRLVPPLVRI